MEKLNGQLVYAQYTRSSIWGSLKYKITDYYMNHIHILAEVIDSRNYANVEFSGLT